VLPVASLSVERQSVFHAALRLIELPERPEWKRDWVKRIRLPVSHFLLALVVFQNGPAQQAIEKIFYRSMANGKW